MSPRWMNEKSVCIVFVAALLACGALVLVRPTNLQLFYCKRALMA